MTPSTRSQLQCRRAYRKTMPMPMLLEDLAEETWSSNQRMADRLDVEVRALDEARSAVIVLEESRQRVIESARQATDYAIARVPPAEGLWKQALAAIRTKPIGDESERVLRSLLGVFETGQRLVRAPRALWEIAGKMGAAAERLGEVNTAEARFAELAAEAKRALDFRAANWRPADPARLTQGLQMAAEGKAVNADEARAWFRRG
jgi:hypothetical protein